MSPRVVFASAALAVIALLAAGPAEGATLVLGGGMAKVCSDAAISGLSNDASLQACNQALETEPLMTRDLAATYVNRGIISLRRKAYANAVTDFNHAVGLQPAMGEAYVNRGAAFVAQRRYQEGMIQIDRAIALGLEEPEKAWYNKGLAFEGLGDPKAAYLAYRKASELAPAWDVPQLELARFTVVHP